MPQSSQAFWTSEKAVSAVVLLAVTSWVNLLALLFHGSRHDIIWVCTPVSVFFTTLIIFLEVNQPGFTARGHPGVSFILLVVWIVNILYQTFLKDAPFRVTSNGYFSAWASLYMACVYVLESNQTVREAFENTQAAAHSADEHSKVEPSDQKDYSTIEK